MRRLHASAELVATPPRLQRAEEAVQIVVVQLVELIPRTSAAFATIASTSAATRPSVSATTSAFTYILVSRPSSPRGSAAPRARRN